MVTALPAAPRAVLLVAITTRTSEIVYEDVKFDVPLDAALFAAPGARTKP